MVRDLSKDICQVDPVRYKRKSTVFLIWVQILPLPLTSHVTLGKTLNLSGLGFLNSKMAIIIPLGLCEMIHIRCFSMSWHI